MYSRDRSAILMSELYPELNFDGVCILTEDGEKKWTWVEFVTELKIEAADGLVQILTIDTATIIKKGTATIALVGQKEESFWNTMDSHGWPSGMHPRVVRRGR